MATNSGDLGRAFEILVDNFGDHLFRIDDMDARLVNRLVGLVEESNNPASLEVWLGSMNGATSRSKDGHILELRTVTKGTENRAGTYRVISRLVPGVS